MSEAVESIQRALKDKGFDPGEVDGIWGRKTISAVRAFQQANGLEVDGVVGHNTAAKLRGDGPAPAPTPGVASPGQPIVWMEEARRLFGTKEKPGQGSNQTLLEWASDLGIPYKSDDIPWCGLFVAHCIGSTLPEEVLPRHPLMARGWKSCGKTTSPREGAILVFWRGSKDGAMGHVGFYMGEDDQAYHVLGGNQSDSVSRARIAKDRLLEARWPTTAGGVESGTVRLATTGGALSTNEA